MRELAVAAADHLDSLYYLVGILLEFLLDVLADGQHGRGAEGIAGVYADGVDIFNEAYGDHVVVCVAYYLELKLFPAAYALLNEHLTYKAGLESAGADYLQLVDVVDHATACAAHGVSRTEHNRVLELLSDLHSFLNGICYLAAGHFNAELLHCVLEFDTILAALDCVDLNADHLHVVLFKYASLAQLGAEVQTGLTAEVRQQRVGALLLDDLGEPVNVERLDVGDVGYIGVGHDGGGVGVHQYDLVSQPAKRLARLRTGIVELARLSDDDRT